MNPATQRSLTKVIRIFIAVSFCVSILSPQSIAHAASITVTNGTSTIADGDGCSLPEAIINANNGDTSGSTDCLAGTFGSGAGDQPDGADTITLNTNVNLTVRSPDGFSDAGLPEIWTYITIQAGTGNTISGNGADFRIFLLDYNTHLTLDGLTVQDGYMTDDYTGSLDSQGGAIYMYSGGTLTLTDMTFRNNTAAGVAVTSGTTTAGGGYGGALYIQDDNTVTITNSSFLNNAAEGGPNTGSGIGGDAYGGAIYIEDNVDLTMSNTDVNGNTAEAGQGNNDAPGGAYGGGIYVSGGSTLDFTSGSISDNEATGGPAYSSGTGGAAQGGGLWAGNNATVSLIGVVDLNTNGVTGNYAVTSPGGAAAGGGIYLQSSVDLTINGTIEANDNYAYAGESALANGGGAQGGAFYIGSSSTVNTLSGISFDGNHARGGLGASAGGDARGGAVYLQGDVGQIDNTNFTNNIVEGGTGTSNRGGDAYGGGMYVGSYIEVSTFDENTFTDNVALGGDSTSNAGGGAWAGALYLRGDVTQFNDNSFSSNQAVGGNGTGSRDSGYGAAYFQCYTINFSGNDFDNNWAKSGDATGNTGAVTAGALYLSDTVNNFTGNTVANNRAESGAASSGSSGDVDGGGLYSDAEIVNFESVTIADNTAQAGDAAGNGGDAYAGGFDQQSQISNFVDVSVSGNTANGGDGNQGGSAYGGGMQNGYTVTNFDQITVSNNTASAGSSIGSYGGDAFGGGLLNWDEITFASDSTFSGNTAIGGDSTNSFGGYAFGGGLENDGMMSYVSDLTITGNSAYGGSGNYGGDASGGGLRNEYQITSLADSTISSNVARAGDGDGNDGGAAYGGGISNEDEIDEISGVTISGNSATGGDSTSQDGGWAYGGGLSHQYAPGLQFYNSTVSGNTVAAGNALGGGSDGEAYGGGVYLESNATLRHLTLLSNTGGTYDDDLYSEDSSNTLISSLVASPGGLDDCAGSFTAGGANLGASGDSSCSVVGAIVLGTDINATLADNGGPTQTHALLPGSTAVNATGASCYSVGNVDQRGEARDSACDSGAFELTDPDLYATKANDVSGATDPATPWTWSVTVANAGGPDAVFADGEIVLTDDLPSGPTYSNLQVINQVDVSGPLTCDYDVSSTGAITCFADGGTVTLSGGSSTFTVTIDAIAPTGTFVNPATGGICKADPDDVFNENNEGDNTCSDTVTVSFAATVTVTATDDTAGENPLDNGEFTVDLGQTNLTGSDITVYYSASGTATAGVDYNLLYGSVIIPDGSQTATIDLIPFNDSLLEGDETVVLTLTSTDTAGVAVDTTPATVTIVDDEQPISTTVTLAVTDNSAAENPLDNAEFTVDLGVVNTTGSAITVSYSVSGSATSGVDYNLLSGSVQVPSGGQVVTITLVPFDDTVLEGDETVTLTLTGTDNAGAAVDSTPATATITDDEQPTLTVDGSGNGTGVMTSTTTITCTSTAGVASGDCDETAAAGTNFAILASPASNSTFNGWAGCDSTSTAVLAGDTCNVTLAADSDSAVTASFVDTTPPVVTGIELLSGRVVNPGDTVGSVVFLVVTFNEDILDYAGWNDTDDVTNPANYSLVGNGGMVIPITMVSYDNNNGAGPFRALVVVNDGAVLPTNHYVFTVSGTTSITDYGGNSLDGDGNGTGGDDFSLAFTAVAPRVPSSGSGLGTGSSAASALALPGTGFAPGAPTILPDQPESKAYYAPGDLWLEIPKLGLQMPIVGVPNVDGEWDVSWLGESAGWLAGTAYPSLEGNTVITGHVWDAFNTPGLFVNLRDLRYGDQISIHIGGRVYTYAVRSSVQVEADNLSPLAHEDDDVVTLITCEGYNATTGEYLYRRAVRAVLVSISSE